MGSELDGEIRDGRHHMAVRIYYEDTDFSGVVYHANYLRFMERGRTNLLRLVGGEQRELYEAANEESVAFVVHSMTLKFFKPARMDDIVTVTTEYAEVKGASITLLQRIVLGKDVLVEAHVRVACVAGGRPRQIPKPLRLAMEAAQAALQSRDPA